MPELRDFSGLIAIVVSSCDPFFDAWRPFALFFRKFWPDCPFVVYLIANELRIQSKWIRPIVVGPDRRWGRKLQFALAQLSEPYVLYMQEDYFLNAPVDSAQVADDLAFAFNADCDSFCFRARTQREPGFQFLGERFGIVPEDSDGRTRCQVTLWKRERLLSIVRPEDSVWDFEARGSARTRGLKILSYGKREMMPLRYTMSAIVRGLWTPEALALCQQHGVEIYPRFRSSYSENRWLQRVRRLLTRWRMERALKRMADHPVNLDAEVP